MKTKLRNGLLKTVPYLLSVAGGAVLYILSKDNIRDPSLDSLVNNIAASLLSIPLVFLLYDYSNYRISRQVNRTLAAGLNFKINSVMLALLLQLRRMADVRGKFTWGTAQKMFEMPAAIARRMKITAADMDKLRDLRDQLDDYAYRTDRNSVLTRSQVQTLAQVTVQMTHMINHFQMSRRDRTITKYAENILGLMGDWFDSQNVAEMLQQPQFQSAFGGAAAPSK
ncbi:hypothetical protein HDR63_03190 [bacterium]|nr:hypothetical protein [bacterium]